MLQFKNISKEYVTGDLVQTALNGVSLNLRENEFVAVLGPSGSGNTTLLNIIGGLDRYDSGDLIINGISTKQYSDRDWDSYRNHTIGFIFQSYNLIPHQSLLSNVELALTISGVSRKERRKRAKEALNDVGLGDQIHKKPNQLSGGQMQRVAIARALVNNPDILLADEPTGALDTDTGLQVMELLKEVAKDRLVVMVTHNPDLAEKYATRIVNLKDGNIIGDSEPYEIDDNALAEPEHKNMGKVSMSFAKSLSLSFNNLVTKKGRTFLTAFAGSIGIIGIALILALSNGVSGYIQSIQEDTMAEYPLQITNSGIDIASLMSSGGPMGAIAANSDRGGEINVTKILDTVFTTISTNDLQLLKEYFDSGESDIYDYTKSIEYIYNVDPQIYREDGNTYRQVNPNSILNLQGGSIVSVMAANNTNVFYKMPENTELYESQYDVMAGRWPENYNECVLVLTQGGSISDIMLYTLGLRDISELDALVEAYNKGEDVETVDYKGNYSYDDVLGIKFKLVNSSDYYEYDDTYEVWTDKTENEKYMYNLVQNGEDLEIVGIVQPAEDATSSPLTSGINYPASLITHIVEIASESDIVKDQLSRPTINIFTNEEFGDDSSGIDMASLFNIDESAMTNSFDLSQMMDGIDLSFDMSDMSQMSDMGMDMSSLTDGFDLTLDMSDLNSNVSNPMDLSNMSNMDLSSMTDSLDMSSMSFDLGDAFDISDFSFDIGDMDMSSIISDVDMPDMDMSTILQGVQISISTDGLNDMITALLAGYQGYMQENPIDFSALANDFSTYLATEDAQKLISNFMLGIIQNSDNFSVSTDNLNELLESILKDYQQWLLENYQDGDISIDAYIAGNTAQTIFDEWLQENISFDSFSIDTEALTELTQELAEGYITWANENNSTALNDIFSSFTSYFESDEAMEIISAGLMNMIDMTSIENQISIAMQAYMMSMMSSYTSAMSSAMEAQIASMSEQMASQISTAISESMAEMMSEYSSTIASQMQNMMSSYSEEISKTISNSMSDMMSSYSTAISSTIASSMGDMMQSYSEGISSAISEMMQSYVNGIADSVSIDPESIASSMGFNMESTDLSDLLTSMTLSSGSGYDNNLATLGYVDFDNPNEIDIYPLDFDSKEEITAILDTYNENMENNGESEKVITYTDIVGTMMSAVSTIINVVSYVLIAFVAVSLIVSSIMIGIITYISVLERTKEIGILRAIGASKRNISQIFNAETFIIGLFAGILGVVISMLLCIPINAIVAILIGDASVKASLSLVYGGILVLLSLFLTIISGLIPARKAAKKDPVTALRTE